MKRLEKVKIWSVFVVLCLTSITANAQNGSVKTGVNKAHMALEVKEAFLHSWYGYKKYAWGHDGLRPVSNTYFDWYSEPFYMSAVEGLDTMILMGLKTQADSTRKFIETNLSFDKDVYVKHFEFTIRMLGGLISAYQLTNDRKLLDLATDLANRMLPVFNSPTGMPYVMVNLKTGAVRGANSNPAEIGSLLVEYGALSKITGNPVYYQKAKKALVELYSRRSSIGLVGSKINVETGKWTGTSSHIDAGIDSYYEYLLKSALLFDDKDCMVMWKNSIKAINKYVADSTSTGLWYGSCDMNTGKREKRVFGALAAFFPAVLALSGDMKQAEALQASCFKMWNKYGIEPDNFNYVTMEAASTRYYLNPEIMESSYYLYHYTRDPKYLEMSKTFFDDLNKYCRTSSGYAELKNVITKDKSDHMDSYFLAETLKYLYLIFAPPSTLDFNKVIFTTEAHPIFKTW